LIGGLNQLIRSRRPSPPRSSRSGIWY